MFVLDRKASDNESPRHWPAIDPVYVGDIAEVSSRSVGGVVPDLAALSPQTDPAGSDPGAPPDVRAVGGFTWTHDEIAFYLTLATIGLVGVLIGFATWLAR